MDSLSSTHHHHHHHHSRIASWCHDYFPPVVGVGCPVCWVEQGVCGPKPPPRPLAKHYTRRRENSVWWSLAAANSLSLPPLPPLSLFLRNIKKKRRKFKKSVNNIFVASWIIRQKLKKKKLHFRKPFLGYSTGEGEGYCCLINMGACKHTSGKKKKKKNTVHLSKCTILCCSDKLYYSSPSQLFRYMCSTFTKALRRHLAATKMFLIYTQVSF